MTLIEGELRFPQIKYKTIRGFISEIQTRPVLDLTGIIKGVMALENLDLYNMEENVGRSSTRIDLGIELYNMEEDL